MSKLKKGTKYNKEIHPQQFFDFCKEGMSLTQIATALETTKEQLLSWAGDERKFEWQAAWFRGKTAAQAYHENLLRGMIREGASGPVIEAQKYILRVQFKDDWSDKQESKIEISNIDRMSTEEIEGQLSKLLKRPSSKKLLGLSKPILKVVGGEDVSTE